jgi:teichoic acid transport system permease protein
VSTTEAPPVAHPGGGDEEDDDDVVHVFEPHSVSMPPVRPYFHELWERRRFIVALAKADLKGARSSTIAGQLWGLLDPIFQAATYWFLITIVRGGQGSNGGSFLTVLIAGVFLFNYSRIALNDGGRAVVKGKGLLLNSTFPRALLPLAMVYKGLLEMVPSAFIYAIIHILAGAPIGPGIVVLPLLFALQTALNIGMALIMATLTVYIRDMANLLTYITRILIFITPVIYPVSLLTPTMKSFLQWNPLFPLFAAYQQIISGGTPSTSYVIQTAIWAALFLGVGVRVFLSHERAFALRL